MLVVTDARLDGLEDGVGLTRRLKLDAATKEIPVVMLTGAILPGERYLAAKALTDGFMSKPCAPDTLLALVRRLVPHAA